MDPKISTMEEARAALAAKGRAEQDLARIALCPPWRHAAFAVSMAILVGLPAVPLHVRMALFTLLFAGIVLIAQSDRRRLGVFLNGYRRGKTRLVTFPLLLVILALYGASTYYGMDRHLPGACVALAVVAFVVAYAGSVIWQKVFRHELGL